MDSLKKTHRTAAIHMGVGSAADNAVRGVEYSFNKLEIFDDKNYTYYSPAHPQLDGIVFWDKHTQPSDDSCVGSILS